MQMPETQHIEVDDASDDDVSVTVSSLNGLRAYKRRKKTMRSRDRQSGHALHHYVDLGDADA